MKAQESIHQRKVCLNQVEVCIELTKVDTSSNQAASGCTDGHYIEMTAAGVSWV